MPESLLSYSNIAFAWPLDASSRAIFDLMIMSKKPHRKLFDPSIAPRPEI